MSEAARHDHWGAGQPYEQYMGRWSRLIARRFLNWLNAPPGKRWLDMGCGTGALTDAILAQAEPASILAVDSSPAFIEHLRQQSANPRLSFRVSDAMDEPATPGFVDIAVSALMLNFVPEPVTALRGLLRSVVPGGTVAFYVWDYPGRMDMLRYFWDSAVSLWPDASVHDEALRFTMCRPEPLSRFMREAGGREVEVTPLEASRIYANFEAFWTPLLGGQGPIPRYVSTLREEERDALRLELRRRLPARPDGSIELVAQAWGVRALS